MRGNRVTALSHILLIFISWHNDHQCQKHAHRLNMLVYISVVFTPIELIWSSWTRLSGSFWYQSSSKTFLLVNCNCANSSGSATFCWGRRATLSILCELASAVSQGKWKRGLRERASVSTYHGMSAMLDHVMIGSHASCATMGNHNGTHNHKVLNSKIDRLNWN